MTKNIIMLAVSMAACLLGGVIRKILINKYENSNRAYYFINFLTALVSAVILAFSVKSLSVSLFTCLTGAAFGIITFAQQLFCLKAMEIGPYGYTNVIISLSTVITALSGFVIWHESISVFQIVGMIVMVGCLVLSVDLKAKGKSKNSIRWLLYTLLSFLLCGGVGLMQKVHQSSEYKAELNVFLVIAFAVMALASLVLMLFSKKEKTDSQEVRKPITSLVPVVLIILCGVCTALNNKFNLYLSGVIDSIIFFPTVNGGGVVLTVLASLALFKEKPTRNQWIGIALGIIAIVLLCIPA